MNNSELNQSTEVKAKENETQVRKLTNLEVADRDTEKYYSNQSKVKETKILNTGNKRKEKKLNIEK